MAQGKAETLAGCLAAADAKRKAAEEDLKRLEIRLGQGRQGLALLKAAKMQMELDSSRHENGDIKMQLSQLVRQDAAATTIKIMPWPECSHLEAVILPEDV